MRHCCAPFALACVLAVAITACARQTAAVVIEDIFGRRLDETHGLVLVDWEGYLANPAIEFLIVPPDDAVFPVRVVLKAAEPRLYFDLPSETGAGGPRKEFALATAGSRSVLVSIFPDRNGEDETHEIGLELHDASGHIWRRMLPVRVVDQDGDEGGGCPITVDFSHDQTGFFDDEMRRRVVIQAARDWMYFFDCAGLDPVAAGAERTFIWDADGFVNGKYVANAEGYTGFLLYVYGIQGVELRSGGEPSRAGGLQSVGGRELPLRRSGGVEIETRGNYNECGWMVSLDDADWWRATNLRNVQNDLYSIAHHEIGHALFANAGYPLFARAKRQGLLDDEQLAAYLGHAPKIDGSEHFPGTVDPASRRGAFGNEYHGEMPRGRWLITKADLLLAQAIGQRLRPTSAFAPLKLETGELQSARVGVDYRMQLRARGGVPFYHWEVVRGETGLPDGLWLDAFTGEIRGVARQAGVFEFIVRVRDYRRQSTGEEKRLVLHVEQ